MTQNDLLRDRASGCLAGLALGDALGTTIEFSRPGTFTPMTDIVGGGPFQLKAGQWTDDTNMALCLADSLLACGKMDLVDQCQRYVRWWREGYFSPKGYCFDIGGATSSALRQFERTGDPHSGSTDPYSAGNGSIMRLAPVPIFFHHDTEEAIRQSAESSRTTHGAATCLDACRYLGGILWGLLNGATREQVLTPGYHPSGGSWEFQTDEIRQIAAGSYKEKNPPQIIGSGYVVQSLEAALWAFYHAEDFRHGALLAVNLGNDADTTGAVYGQLGGAWQGLSGLPTTWLDILWDRERILDFALRLTGSAEP